MLDFAFRIHDGDTARDACVTISHTVIAGWTGRDRGAVEHHIRELEALGVARPATTPVFYRVATHRLSQAPAIEVSGAASSGEVEFLLVQHDGQLHVGVGSDHTDREVETYGVTVSKQMCDKPIAGDLWRFADVRDHWDRLTLRSWIDGEQPYQDGSVTTMLPPLDLIELYATGGELADGTLMFCGTLAAIGGIRPSPRFGFALEDPVLGRSIRHEYAMLELPVMG